MTVSLDLQGTYGQLRAPIQAGAEGPASPSRVSSKPGTHVLSDQPMTGVAATRTARDDAARL